MAWEQRALFGEGGEVKRAMMGLGVGCFVVSASVRTPPSEGDYTRDSRGLLLLGDNLPW